jgi:hypothetical protein
MFVAWEFAEGGSSVLHILLEIQEMLLHLMGDDEYHRYGIQIRRNGFFNMVYN